MESKNMNANDQAEYHQDNSILFALFTIWSLIVICRPQDYFSLIGHLRPALVLGLLLLLLSALKTNKKPVDIVNNSQLRLYRYMLIMLMISIPFSYYRSGSLFDLLQYSSVAIFVFMFYVYVNTILRLRKLLFLYCIGIGLYGIAILLKGSFEEGRISFGTMFDPNDIAFYILSFITLNLIFMTKNNSLFVRTISLFNITTGLIIILKTGSRGGLVALLMVIAFLLFSKNRVFNTSLITKAAILMMVFLLLQFINFNNARYKTILDLRDDYNTTGEEGRIAIWKSGMKMMFTHPFTGVGFNRFPEGAGRDREARGLDSAKWQTAHNSLIQIGAETGIIGFILFWVLSLNAFKIFSRISRNSESGELAAIGEFAKVGFLGLFVGAMFLSQAYSVYWAFYIGFSAVMKRFAEDL